MDIDWGGQGPANMPSGNNCYQLGSDKCAQITGSGNSTSSMGVPGMGTTFINTIDISELDIENGGRTNYTIKVDLGDMFCVFGDMRDTFLEGLLDRFSGHVWEVIGVLETFLDSLGRF